MILPELLAALEQVVQTGLVQSVVAAIRRPPIAHEHAGVVGPQHRGGIVEPPAGADGVDRRVRGDERPQPVADAADAPAGLVRRDHGRVANLLAQLRVGRGGGAGRPVQHVGEAARRDLQAERGPQQVGNLRQRHPHLCVQLDDQRDNPGTELHARRAQRVGGLQHVVALHPPLTLRAVADLDVEAAHDRAHHGQFFLILRRHAGHFDRAAAVRTRHRNRRRVGLVDPRRARAAAVAAILRTGPPSGTPPATLRPVLGKRRSLPATLPACLVQLPFQALDLLLQTVILPLQAVVLALQALRVALAPGQLPMEPFDFGVQVLNPILIRTPVRGRHANVMPQVRNLYVYALEPAWRARLAVPTLGIAPLAAGDGLDAGSWADHEFGGAPLGDARLSARLVQSAQHMAQSPMRAITGATNGARALVKGHYRLIDQPADGAVTVDNILEPHRERTLRRMRAHDTVLCIQDGTRLNFTRRSHTQGLGTIGSNQTGAVARGLDLHTTLAVNPDGVALGVLRAAFDAPAPPNPDEKDKPKPREERKSFRWVEGLRDCAQTAERLPETRVVCTMDREADFLDLFIERRANAPQVELLVRAKVDRVVGTEKTPDGRSVPRRLFDQVRNAPPGGACTVEVQRLSARVKASKQARKDSRAARVAEVTLRYQQVALPCAGAAAVELWVVHAREEHPPPTAEPLEWFVLTTLPVTGTADATRVLRWYALRWRIEEYFRVLKSGCKVEELQHHAAERLERAIAIKMVVGWRIQLMVQLGREVPELPGELLFSDGELRVLATFARSRTLPPPTRLGDAVGLVGRLGGWLGRTRDPPGAQLLWHGYTQLVAMAFAFELRDEYG